MVLRKRKLESSVPVSRFSRRKKSISDQKNVTGSPNDSSKDYKVSKILGTRIVDGKIEYLLSWDGYELDDSSWEPEENLKCSSLLESFKLEMADNKQDHSEYKKDRTIPPSSFDALPPELQHGIFKLLPKSSKQNVRLVCSQWKHKVDDWFFKHNAVLTDGTSSIVRNSGLHFDTLTVQNLGRSLASQCSKFTRSRSDLAFNPRKLIFSSHLNPSHGSIWEANTFTSKLPITKENIELILLLNSGISELIFNRCVRADTRLSLNGLYLSNLRHFEISISRSTVHPIRTTVFNSLSKLKMPSLTTMRLTVEESGDDDDQIYVGIYELIASCKGSVKHLSVSFHRFHYFSNQENSLPLSVSRLALLRKDLSQVKLESLVITLDDLDEAKNKNLALRLLTSQDALKSLEVRFHLSKFALVAPAIQKTLVQNSTTLVNVTFRRCICSIRLEEIPNESEANHVRSMLQPLGAASSPNLESLTLFGLPFRVNIGQLPILPNLKNLSPTIKTLKISGDVDPRFFRDITVDYKTCLPRLENLFIFSTAQDGYCSLVKDLNQILDLSPELKLFQVYVWSLQFDLRHFKTNTSKVLIEKANLAWDNWHFKRRVRRFTLF